MTSICHQKKLDTKERLTILTTMFHQKFSWLASVTVVLFGGLTGCSTHQFDQAFINTPYENGVKYHLDETSLTVQVQRYQFYPNTREVMLEARSKAKEIANKLNVNVTEFDSSTDRNKVLGITSVILVGQIRSVNSR